MIRSHVKKEEPSDQGAFVRLVNQLTDATNPRFAGCKDVVANDFAKKLSKVPPVDRENVVSTFEVLTKPHHFKQWNSYNLSTTIAVIAEMTAEKREHFVNVANDLFQKYNYIPPNALFGVVNFFSEINPKDWDDIASKSVDLFSPFILNQNPEDFLIKGLSCIAKVPTEERGRFVDVVQSLKKRDKKFDHNITFSSVIDLIEIISNANPEDWDDIVSKVTQLIKMHRQPEKQVGNYSESGVVAIVQAMAKVKKEHRDQFISIVESFTLGNSTIFSIGATAEALSAIPFERWDDVVENINALAPRTRNKDSYFCIKAMEKVAPEMWDRIIKQVLRFESLTGGYPVSRVIDRLNELDIQDWDHVVEAALLLAPNRSPEDMIFVMGKTSKEQHRCANAMCTENPRKMSQDSIY